MWMMLRMMMLLLLLLMMVATRMVLPLEVDSTFYLSSVALTRGVDVDDGDGVDVDIGKLFFFSHTVVSGKQKK
jgi:hypothetical protein